MRVAELIQFARELPDCRVLPPSGRPIPEVGHIVPSDLAEFYDLCGGIHLFRSAPFSAAIVEPSRCVLANPIIVGERADEDLSSSWYIIVDDGNGDFLTIDLAPARLGRCYDSFFDRHGVPGSCPVIARSFTELLQKLIENGGQHWYWLEDGFAGFGDAYDQVSL